MKDTPKLEEVMNQVNGLISWYRENGGGIKEQNFKKLLDFNRKLVTLIPLLSYYYTIYSKGYKISYIQRKYTVAFTKAQYINKGDTVGFSDAMGEVKAKEKRQAEVLNYQIAESLNLLRSDARLVLDISRQQVSYLKEEFKDKNHNDGTVTRN